jgi:asparagine synthase (glutamine-hydrolysing)
LGDVVAVETLDALLRDAVGLRMQADVPLGAFLSGGVDSSTVVALMQAQAERPVRTFAIGFEEAGFNEAPHARAVARHLGTDHTELVLDWATAMDVVPRLPSMYDEPFADPSQIPTFLVAQLARGHVTVALSGDGGDELFAGYRRHTRAHQLWQVLGRVPYPVRRLASRGVARLPAGVWGRVFGVGTASRLKHGARAAADYLAARDRFALYYRIASTWSDPSALALETTEPVPPVAVAALREGFDHFTDEMTFLDLVSYLPDDILVKVDRASMAVSLEGRMPFLDHRVVELAWRLPLRLKVRDGQGKWILRRVLDRYVPRALVERPKMGFGVPIDGWLRGPLRDWAEALLDERVLRDGGYLAPEPVRRAWRDHLAGTANNGQPLWVVLMFQAWLQSVGPTPAPV